VANIKYEYAMAEVEEARRLYDYAAVLLENRRIKCRLAEIESQHNPAASIIGNTNTTREQLVAAARFVVLGEGR